MGWGWYRDRPRRKPVVGGIQARNKRGDFGETWWGQRWTAVLYRLGMGERLTRGRTYARTGRVLSMVIEPGLVRSQVQGSWDEPYDIEIRLRTFSKAEQAKLAEALAADPFLAARLLAGELPEALEPLCEAAGLPLFPAVQGDLKTACDCPDYANPCKHIAAVYCLLAEAFDTNPFLALTLRGLTREELTAQVMPDTVAIAPPEPEPLPTVPEEFWRSPPLPPDPGLGRPPAIGAAVLQRLGAVPFWRGTSSLLETLEPVYLEATRVVGERLTGSGGSVRDEPAR